VQQLLEDGIGKFLLFAHHHQVMYDLAAMLQNSIGDKFVRIDGLTLQQDMQQGVTALARLSTQGLSFLNARVHPPVESIVNITCRDGCGHGC
jgi:hypothetical protein